jgi:hypothetical protein
MWCDTSLSGARMALGLIFPNIFYMRRPNVQQVFVDLQPIAPKEGIFGRRLADEYDNLLALLTWEV